MVRLYLMARFGAWDHHNGPFVWPCFFHLTGKAKAMPKQANAYLRELYLDWWNNYLTIEKFAEHNEISIEIATILLAKGKKLHGEFVKMAYAA